MRVTTGSGMQRTTAAGAVKVVAGIAALAVAWQAVRFCLGDIGNVTTPVFEAVRQAMSAAYGLPEPVDHFNPLASIAELGSGLIQWLMGFAFWLVAAAAVACTGDTIARVLAVGWHQYRTEQREAREAARIAEERQAAKDRRRELRRKVLETREPRRGSSGFFSFVIGVMLGAFFF
ncbi:MAG: hypothetical protein VB135_02580 [Burkholderia sp.]